MKHGITITMWLITGVVLLAGAAVNAEESDNDIKVDVYAKHHASKIIYNYRVFNNTEDTIDAITVGLDSLNDSEPNNDVWELKELPSGWTAKLGIPAANSNAATGWRVSLKSPEKGDTYAVTWDVSNSKTPKLTGGQSMAKMSVSLDNPDNSYLFGHATVHFEKRVPDTLTVPLEQLDIEPPALEVALEPATLTPSGKLVPINVNFTVKTDYYDPLPQIRLESISADEPLAPDDVGDASIGIDDRYIKLRATTNELANRIYTVIYSATDGSGNQTLASATVTVQHAQPEIPLTQ